MDKVSDINKVNKLSRMIYKKNVEPSKRKNKKYMIMNDDQKYIHFGDLRYEDYTKHQDLKRLNNYLSRATKIKGNWKKDKYSPNNLAINLLWNNSKAIRRKMKTRQPKPHNNKPGRPNPTNENKTKILEKFENKH